MKLLIDTNIIVDVALDRDPFFTNSEQVLARVEQQEIQKEAGEQGAGSRESNRMGITRF